MRLGVIVTDDRVGDDVEVPANAESADDVGEAFLVDSVSSIQLDLQEREVRLLGNS